MFILVPPLPATYKRGVHRALRVPEILLIIFKYIINDSGKPFLPALAAIARTSRRFQCVVEEVLWHKLPQISALYNILPPQVRNKESQTWSLSRRMLSGSEWTRFMDRASRVRVLKEHTTTPFLYHERCWTIFLAMAALRDPPVLTPNLRELKWRTSHPLFCRAINIFLSPSLQSLEIDAKLFINQIIRLPLGNICPKIEYLKITGNGRSAVDTISSLLRGLHNLEKVACSTLDNDAFLHLAQLKRLSYLMVDMRWSELQLDLLRDRLGPGSFQSLQTLHWKDYKVNFLAEMFLMPDVSPSNVNIEIESFCTSASLRTFLQSFVAKFPHTRHFSLVHDIEAAKRFGLHVGPPGREHRLDACDLEPLLSLKSLRALTLEDLGNLWVNDDLIKTIASESPALEQLRLGTDAADPELTSVTFEGLLALLQRCPKLSSVGVRVDAEDVLAFWKTTVRHLCVTHLRLVGRVLESRRVEVDAVLRRVMPGLRTVEESLDGTWWRVREMGAPDEEYGEVRGRVEGRPTSSRWTRNSREGARGG